MISIIIPSRVDQYLQKTIDDLLLKAKGEVEIIVVLDGYWTLLKDDKRVRIIHQGILHDSLGMRSAINSGVAIARGDYIMKIDEHCMVSEGYDERLSTICGDDWAIVPRRKRLDADKWELIHDGRPDIDYMYIEYPYAKPYDQTQGLHGAEDKQRAFDRKDYLVDDLMTMQGSCYFMSRKHWDKTIVRMEEENYGPFTMEAQEISCKTWLSGGRVVVDKGSWYAHFHKGSKGKGYGFSNEQWRRHAELNEKGRLYAMEYWLHTKDYPRDFKWLIDKFYPVKGWKDTWQQDILIDREKDYSTLGYKDNKWLINLRDNQ